MLVYVVLYFRDQATTDLVVDQAAVTEDSRTIDFEPGILILFGMEMGAQ